MSATLDAPVGAATGPGRRRALLTFADQAVSSGSNFLVALVVVVFTDPERYGRFALLVTTWLVMVALHRALICEPLVIRLGAFGAEDRRIRAGLGAELVLGAALAALVAGVAGVLAAAGMVRMAVPLLVLAAALTPLLVQDYWRATAFRLGRPGVALVSDVLFAVVQIGVLVSAMSAGWRDLAAPVTAWGIGAAAGAAFGMAAFAAGPGVGILRDGLGLLRDLWADGRWLVAEAMTSLLADQTWLVAAAFLLSEADYGVVRLAWQLMGPVMVLLLGAGHLTLPESARRLAAGGVEALRAYAVRVSRAVGSALCAYAVVVGLGAEIVVHLVDDRYAGAGAIAACFGLQYAIVGFAFGHGHALKVAGAARVLWRVRLVVSAVSLVAVVVCIPLVGRTGAGIAGIVNGVTGLVAVRLAHRGVFATESAARPMSSGHASPQA